MTKPISFMRLVAVASLMLGFYSSQAHAQVQPNEFAANQAEVNPGDVVLLKDQLLNGLRAVTSEQKAYVAQIVNLVDQGKMPRAMVNVVYKWALERNPSVPLPYFQIALRALAQRRGIAVP